VNLGLLDAATLADVITSAWEKQRDYASFANLRRYERWRKGDNILMLAFVAMIKNLFGSEVKTVKILRNAGLNLTNQTDFVKNFLARYATGNRNDLPELARV
jgi:2-octaprenylphenol hydroxylase